MGPGGPAHCAFTVSADGLSRAMSAAPVCSILTTQAKCLCLPSLAVIKYHDQTQPGKEGWVVVVSLFVFNLTISSIPVHLYPLSHPQPVVGGRVGTQARTEVETEAGALEELS